MRKVDSLNRIAQQELRGRKLKAGDETTCILCGQPLRVVEGFDLEHFLQTGAMIPSGTTCIHLSPEAAAKCRAVRNRR